MVKSERLKDTMKGKKALVVGIARSGVGAANMLASFGADVTAVDKGKENLLEANIKRLNPSVRVITGGNPEDVFITSDLIVVSPGVPMNIPQIIKAKDAGVEVIGELELAYEIIRRSAAGSQLSGRKGILTPSFIAITGTNGKSTTTMLTDLIMRESGFKTLLGGNIGSALTEEILMLQEGGSGMSDIDCVVAEISSFQLESIKDFKPDVAVILNITPDHLDRYKTMKEYIDAKARIYENQGEGDFLILNAGNLLLKEMGRTIESSGRGPKACCFSLTDEVEGIYLNGSAIVCNLPMAGTGRFPLIDAREMKIGGTHNIENAMAASLAALLKGASPEAVRRALMSFPGLEHRNEEVAVINGVRFINDSKGTNVGAVEKSLENFDNVILIMGGLDKGGDFTSLRSLIREKVKLLVLMGDAKNKIAESVGDVTDVAYASDMNNAVETAFSRGAEGDVVLLSPGCASFDMFRDFEDRGRRFKEAVNSHRREGSLRP
ncbi:MAG: UDP-N-acetylmuramoyl-L-alanine--D-glutamate ligase [Nitrospirae bacterium]|nr:UDP-N-acetylmuramoyl-L-alanine--D-glutamate ligase [Nitrospirota bacterium]